MSHMHGIIRALAAAAFAASCSGRDPAPMPEDRFVDLYVRDLDLSRRHASVPDSLRASREALYRSEGMKGEDMDRARAWYRRHPEFALRMMEKVAERLESEESARRGGMVTGKGPTR
jgi:hypothetical protein